jgi:hypothetical protein
MPPKRITAVVAAILRSRHIALCAKNAAIMGTPGPAEYNSFRANTRFNDFIYNILLLSFKNLSLYSLSTELRKWKTQTIAEL